MQVRGLRIRGFGPAVGRVLAAGSSRVPVRTPACRGSCRFPPATCSSDRRCWRRSGSAGPPRTPAARPRGPGRRRRRATSAFGARRRITTPIPTQGADPGVPGARHEEGPGSEGKHDRGQHALRSPARARSRGRAAILPPARTRATTASWVARSPRPAACATASRRRPPTDRREEPAVSRDQPRPLAPEGQARRGHDRGAHHEARRRHVVAEKARGPVVEAVEAEGVVLEHDEAGQGDPAQEGSARDPLPDPRLRE